MNTLETLAVVGCAFAAGVVTQWIDQKRPLLLLLEMLLLAAAWAVALL